MTRLCRFVLFATLAGCATSPTSGPDDPGYSQVGGKADGTWCHVNFWSVEGANIRVDYQVADDYNPATNIYKQTAHPAWLNVQRADLASASSVHVWIGDQSYWDPEGYDYARMWGDLTTLPDTSLDLYRSPDPSRFTSEVANGLSISNIVEGDDKPTLHAHQLAIDIDGQWQTDPISNGHNFLATDLDRCPQ